MQTRRAMAEWQSPKLSKVPTHHLHSKAMTKNKKRGPILTDHRERVRKLKRGKIKGKKGSREERKKRLIWEPGSTDTCATTQGENSRKQQYLRETRKKQIAKRQEAFFSFSRFPTLSFPFYFATMSASVFPPSMKRFGTTHTDPSDHSDFYPASYRRRWVPMPSQWLLLFCRCHNEVQFRSTSACV